MTKDRIYDFWGRIRVKAVTNEASCEKRTVVPGEKKG